MKRMYKHLLFYGGLAVIVLVTLTYSKSITMLGWIGYIAGYTSALVAYLSR